MKSGIEGLSGLAMDDVKVHFNSTKPGQLQAHAFAQGADIHMAPGQEKHLPHEVWHVVQQKQVRVKPTTQLRQKVKINDDPGLEKEADVMGAKASAQSGSLVKQRRAASPAKEHVLQRQTGEMAQDTHQLKKGTKVQILKVLGLSFRVKVIGTEKTYWIEGRARDYFTADSPKEKVSESIPSKPVEKETEVGKVTVLDKAPSPKDVIVDNTSKPVEKPKSKKSESSAPDVLAPAKLDEQVELKVTPRPTLAAPEAGKKIFESGGGDKLKVDVTRKGGKEAIDLKAGQNYLNDEKSLQYYGDESKINHGEVTYGAFGDSYVLADGHHRFLWMSHYDKPVKAMVKRTFGGQAWSEMKYQPDPKKPKKQYLQDATIPALDIESENLDTKEAPKKLRAKWEAINWGELKKPGLIFSTEDDELTTTAQYNPVSHTIKLNKDETDPVKLWDNVLFESQNALNAVVFDDLGEEKGGKSATTFQEFGSKMATAEYGSVKRYVQALRELIKDGLKESSLTTLAKNNLAKWKKWDEDFVEESKRIETFNTTPHSLEDSKKDTKAALSTEELYAYEAIETSLVKNIKGKMSLILKDIFSNSAANGYYGKDQFGPLKNELNNGLSGWPKDGAARVVALSVWLGKLIDASGTIEGLVSMSGSGVSGETLAEFKQEFRNMIEGAKPTAKCVSVARKLAKL